MQSLIQMKEYDESERTQIFSEDDTMWQTRTELVQKLFNVKTSNKRHRLYFCPSRKGAFSVESRGLIF